MGEWRYSSTILELGTRWRLVVSFTHWRFTPEKQPQVDVGEDVTSLSVVA
jgi:hypothetical protein